MPEYLIVDLVFSVLLMKSMKNMSEIMNYYYYFYTMLMAYISGEGLGDPHIMTIDGFPFTFNGLGEYILLNSTNFALHGRTAVYINDGVEQSATYFNGFVAKQYVPESDTVEFLLDETHTKIGTWIKTCCGPSFLWYPACFQNS